MTNCPSRLVDPIHGNARLDAQFLNNSLFVSVVSSITAALTLYLGGNDMKGGKASRVLEAILALINIGISYGALGCLSRSIKRAEDVRIEFLDTKLLRIMQGVFTIMSTEAQNAIPPSDDPFGLDLENRLCRFHQVATKNGLDDSEVAKLIDACHLIRQDMNNTDSIRQFQSQLLGDAIYGIRHENSSLQAAVLDLNDWCSIRLRFLDQEKQKQRHRYQANPRHYHTGETLYKRLEIFRKNLEKSVVRDSMLSWRYWFRSLTVIAGTLRVANWTTTTLWTNVDQIYGGAYLVSCYNKHALSPRQVYDIQVMLWATLHIDIVSMILVPMLLLHVASWTVATFRVLTLALGDISLGTTIPNRSSTAVFVFSVMLGVCPSLQRWFVLWKLKSVLAAKMTASSHGLSRDNQVATLKINKFVVARLVVQTLQILGPWLEAYAVECSLVMLDVSAPSDRKETMTCSLWNVLGLTFVSTVAGVGSFALESYVFGKNSGYPRLGKDVMEAFHDELEQLYLNHAIPLVHEIDPPPAPSSSSVSQPNQKQTYPERKLQEWAHDDVGYEFLHKYPLDLVFPDVSVASIVTFLQHGIDHYA